MIIYRIYSIYIGYIQSKRFPLGRAEQRSVWSKASCAAAGGCPGLWGLRWPSGTGRGWGGAWPVPPGHRFRQLERKCYIANPLTLQVGASRFIWTRYVFCKNKTREGLTPELRTLSLHTGSCTLGSHLSVMWTRLHKWAQGPLVLVTGGLQERGSPILEGLRISPNLVPLQEKQEGVSQHERPCHPQQLLREPGRLPPRSSFQLLG